MIAGKHDASKKWENLFSKFVLFWARNVTKMMDRLWKDVDFILAGNRVIYAGSIVLQIKSPEIFCNCVAQVKHNICR